MQSFEQTLNILHQYINSDMGHRYIREHYLEQTRKLIQKLEDKIKFKMQYDKFEENKDVDNLAIEILDFLLFLRLTQPVDNSFITFTSSLTLLSHNYNSLANNDQLGRKIHQLQAIETMEMSIVDAIDTLKTLTIFANSQMNSKREIYDINKAYLDILLKK